MSIWFVRPEEVKIDLVYVDPAGGEHPFWITVKRMLTVGEQHRVMTSGWKGIGRDKGVDIDWQAQTFARTDAYLLDWSLADDAGRIVPLGETLASRAAVIESLDPAVYALIENAITAHVRAVAAGKKQKPSAPESTAMSA